MTIKTFRNRKNSREVAGNQEYITGQAGYDGRVGLDIVNRAVFDVERRAATAISGNKVTIVGTAAMEGDIIQHVASGEEFTILSVNGNIVNVTREVNPAFIGDFDLKRYVTTKVGKDGAYIVSAVPAPILFRKDAVTSEVSEDTATPANNNPLPTKILDDAGLNVAVRLPLSLGEKSAAASFPVVLPQAVNIPSTYINCAVTNVTVAGVSLGAIVAAKGVYVASNADDVALEVDGVNIATCLAGSPVYLEKSIPAGTLVIKSLTGATISEGTITISFIGA